MKTLTLILIAVVVESCSAYLIKVPTSPLIPGTAPVGWVHIQKLMLPLFENVCEDSTNEIVVRLAQKFTLVASNGEYKKNDVVENLGNIKTVQGFLPRGEIFSEYNTSHINELKALYEIFYYAKDFDTFYKAACWARQNINCGIFIDALYTAVTTRKETAKISIPPPYEILPNYFIRKDVIIQASSLLAGVELQSTDNVRVENSAYILDADYTTDFNDDDDSKLAYFREDIGLNSYYYLRKLRNTLWLNSPSRVNNDYGDYLFALMKHITARYDLERYSYGLPELESVKWDSVVAAYNPLLIYSNGNEFGHRTLSGIIDDSDDIIFLKTIENNIAAVVTHLKQAGHNKTQILNHLLDILTTSDKNYETVARGLLGYNMKLNERQYSTLEHYLTTLRDPVYWKITKKIVELIDDGLKVLPCYTRNELYFPGLEVLSIDTKKMMTSFDTFQFDVTDSLKENTENTTYQVKIAQMRLNHKPFTIKLNISSLAMQKGLIKIYLGPRTMPGELTLKKKLFMLIDRFEFDFKRGINAISRSSEEMRRFSDDFISLQEQRKNIEDAEFGLDSLPLKDVDTQIRFPARLILPKGLPEGLPVQLFVFVAPFYKNVIGSPSSMTRELNSVILSPGYPLDLTIDEKMLFNLPNALVKDIIITHKDESKSSSYGAKTGSKKFDSKPYSSYPYSTNDDSYHASTHGNGAADENSDFVENKELNFINNRPSYTLKNKNSVDYTAKRNQYKNKEKFNKLFNDQIIKTSNEKNDQEIAVNNQFIYKNDDYETDDRIHGLLGSRPDYSYNKKYKNVNKNIYSNLATQSTSNQKYSNSKTDIDVSDVKNEKTKQMNRKQIENNYLVHASTDNVHWLLSDRPDFTYKNKDYINNTGKRNQYQNEKGEYEAKRVLYKKEDYRKKNSDNFINSEQIITKKDPEEIESKNLNKIYITIDDGNSEVYKNIYEDKLNKNEYFDKSNTGKPEIITKDSFKNLLIQNFLYTSVNKNAQSPSVEIDHNVSLSEKDTTDVGSSEVHKDVYGDKLNKKIYFDKGNTEKSEFITNEILKNPLIQNILYTDVNENVQSSSAEIDHNISSSANDSTETDNVITYEPIIVPEVPKRRVTVYDYLFNFDNGENRVYE